MNNRKMKGLFAACGATLTKKKREVLNLLSKKESAIIFVIGSVGYTLLELLGRGYTSWTMTATGGVCFQLLYRLRQKISRLNLWKQCLAGGGVITAVELVSGGLFNKLLKMQVWDYSEQPCNFKGQICLLYSLLWCLLCLPVLALCSWLKRCMEQ